MFPPDCSLITSCFSLTHTIDDDCVNRMKPLLQIPCYLVIFTDNYCFHKIKNLRTAVQLEHLTYIAVVSLTDLYFYKNFVGLFPERHLIKLNKFQFMLETIRINPFLTMKFGWIDYHLFAENSEPHLLLHALHHSPPKKFNLQIVNVCDKKYKRTENKKDYWSQHRPMVRGSLFIADKRVAVPILERLHEIAVAAANQGYGGSGEEMCFLEVLDEFYDDIEKSYADGPIQHVIVQKYVNFEYYKEGYDCCKKIVGEIEDFAVPMTDYDAYFKLLFSYYICAFYHRREEARPIYKRIMKMVEINPYIRREYFKNKDYYDAQFLYVSGTGGR